jgi:hypothetical protein
MFIATQSYAPDEIVHGLGSVGGRHVDIADENAGNNIRGIV